MKKIFAAAFVLVALIAAICFAGATAAEPVRAEADYLRIHVRANSNDQTDQSVKYIVKDEVVKFITPYAAQCVDKTTAIELIESVLPEIEEVCDKILKENGFDYTSRAEVRVEEFPTRIYGDLTLEAGLYDALIIELGTGAGDNWWCVIYPPLCFTAGAESVEYRSAIYEIIKKFFD